MQAVYDFLSGLPSRNPENFQKWSNDAPKQNITRRPVSYVPTNDIPAQQVIVTEKNNILLRYLNQQIDKKRMKNSTKRENTNTAPATDEDTQRKRQRYE